MEFLEVIKSIFDLKKIPTKFFLVISVITGLYIFANSDLLVKLRLDGFEEHAKYISLAFLFSTSLLIVNILLWILKSINQQINIWKIKKRFKRLLKTLDNYEKSVLREFYIVGKSSLKMPVDDSVVSGLINKRILVYNKQFGETMIGDGMNFSISINKYASDKLTHEDINLPIDNSDESRKFLLSNRPDWIERVNKIDNLLNGLYNL